jgi:type II secretory pathway pseudopilin PulG
MSNVEGMTKCKTWIARRLFRRSGFVIDSSSRSKASFTVIEILVVIAIIIILTGLILSTVGYVQKKGARSRAEAEIAAISAALESYKADNGIYPACPSPTPGAHALYQSLSGDGNDAIGGSTASTGVISSTGKSYMALKNNMLKPIPPNATTRVVDPFGNDYGYNSPGANNPTFDLWSVADANPASNQTQWIKNW